jgi:hypothetical protein
MEIKRQLCGAAFSMIPADTPIKARHMDKTPVRTTVILFVTLKAAFVTYTFRDTKQHAFLCC